jgi:glycosyltransferase involved in cell wall biosynthesis
MDLSVVIPSHNHCEFLRETLGRIARQMLPSGIEWEVIVVDNNCTDSTASVVGELAVNFPALLRCVQEPKQGVASARNCGIDHAEGRLVVFIDDDTFPENHWMRTIWETFETYDCDCVIGRIELYWRTRRPGWCTDDVLGFLGRLDYGAQPKQIATIDEPPNGGNMAFKRAVFQEIGGFDPGLGRKGSRSLSGGEEPELFERFLGKGFTAVYRPDAVVQHVIDAWRMRKSYFRKVHFIEGRIRGARSLVRHGRNLAGIPLFTFPQLFRSIWVFLRTCLHSGFDGSLRKEMNVWYLLGFMVGSTNRRSLQ